MCANYPILQTIISPRNFTESGTGLVELAEGWVAKVLGELKLIQSCSTSRFARSRTISRNGRRSNPKKDYRRIIVRFGRPVSPPLITSPPVPFRLIGREGPRVK
jgi:hypothetical protein